MSGTLGPKRDYPVQAEELTMSQKMKPADDYDVTAWEEYYLAHPGEVRSVGADGAEEEAPEEAPVSPEAEETPEEAAAEGEVEPEAEPEGEDQEEGAPAKGRSEAYQKLLAKYGGDEEKLAESYFEQAGSVARLAKDMEELKELLVSKADTGKDVEAAINQDQLVRELSEEVASIQYDIQSAQQKQMVYVTEHGQLVKDIARLEGELKRADEVDRQTIRLELDQKQRELSYCKGNFEAGEREIKELNRNLKTQHRMLAESQTRVKERLDKERTDRLKVVQQARQAKEDFNGAMRAEAKAYGIDPSSKLYGFVHQGVRAQVVEYLKTLDPEGPGIDMEEAVGELMAEFAKEAGLSKGFKKASELKKQAALPTRETEPKVEPKGGGQPKSLDARMKTAAYWKERAAQIVRRGKAS